MSEGNYKMKKGYRFIVFIDYCEMDCTPNMANASPTQRRWVLTLKTKTALTPGCTRSAKNMKSTQKTVLSKKEKFMRPKRHKGGKHYD